MGASCFSRPLSPLEKRSNLVAEPVNHQQNSNGTENPMPMVHAEHQIPMPPPVSSQNPQQSEPRPIAPTKFLTPMPAPADQLIASPGDSALKSPPSPVQQLTRRVTELFRVKSLVHSEKSKILETPGNRTQDLEKTKRKIKKREFKQSDAGRRRSMMSVGQSSLISNTSSILGLSDGLAGLYALASLTAYESKLVPVIWQKCLEQNKYYCEHALSRLFNRHPEFEDMFRPPDPTCPLSNDAAESNDQPSFLDAREFLQDKADNVMAFLNRLIMTHELDYDRLLEECEQLGRSHAIYFYEHGLQSYHWDAFAVCLVQEYKKTFMNVDLDTDDKELQQLAWTHFTTAIVSTIKHAFEEELQHMTPRSQSGN